MSSRLFRTIREENGLCYSVYTYTVSHEDTGMCAIYMALNPQSQDKALVLTDEVIRDILENGVTDKELRRAKEQARTTILMSLENTASRMNTIARSLLLHGVLSDPDETIAKYDRITANELIETARKYFIREKMSISVVGREI